VALDSQRTAGRRGFSGGRILSSGLVVLSAGPDGASGCDGWLVESDDRATASSDADDSGIGELGGVLAGASLIAEVAGVGAAGGAGSLARGALTEVSPVNGFLYSVCGVMTSNAVGL
jgi:hypothetical protein